MNIEPENVEHDLILSKIIIDLYKCPSIQNSLAFVGDTALQKLYFESQNRYSEDLEFMYLERGSMRILLDQIKEELHWLVNPTSKINDTKACLSYKLDGKSKINTFITDVAGEIITSKIKLTIYPYHCYYFRYDLTTQKKYQQTSVTTYPLEHLLAAKMLALYQKKKGRDLIDLYYALRRLNPNPIKIIQAFDHLQKNIGTAITRALFEENLSKKIINRSFLKDVYQLTQNELWTGSEVVDAMKYVHKTLITILPGETWEGDLEGIFSSICD